MTIIPHSHPTPSKELLVYEAILPRKKFSLTERNYYENIQKGYIGEVKFAELLREHPSSYRLALFDFLFESNQTEFQIDSLIITHNTIYLLEVKYFESDFYIENDKWYVLNSQKEIRNPLLQLQRTEFLFKQMLQKLNVNLTVKPYIIFNNEKFTLYQTPLGLPLVFPTQLTRFVAMLNSNSRKITNFQTKLADRLKEQHLAQSKNSRLPEYKYSELKKGIVCKHCPTFLFLDSRFELKCKRCGRSEAVDTAVKRNTIEFNFLFPDQHITTNLIYEWCAEVISKERIRRILANKMTFIPNARYSHYIFKK